MGWGVIDVEEALPPAYVGSGIFGINRGDESWQDYKLKIIKFHADNAIYLLDNYKPDVVVGEIIPAIGGHNFKSATQEQLAQAGVDSFYAIAHVMEIPVCQIAANTVKKAIGGKGDATKVKVRNGVMLLLPVLADRKKQWTKIFDEPDGIAVGLAHAGFEIPPLAE